MFLDPAGARAIRGPASMDGIGPCDDWQRYWMEVDTKRRRAAPWKAPIPAEIAAKLLPAAE